MRQINLFDSQIPFIAQSISVLSHNYKLRIIDNRDAFDNEIKRKSDFFYKIELGVIPREIRFFYSNSSSFESMKIYSLLPKVSLLVNNKNNLQNIYFETTFLENQSPNSWNLKINEKENFIYGPEVNSNNCLSLLLFYDRLDIKPLVELPFYPSSHSVFLSKEKEFNFAFTNKTILPLVAFEWKANDKFIDYFVKILTELYTKYEELFYYKFSVFISENYIYFPEEANVECFVVF